jgi:hypothetical protein
MSGLETVKAAGTLKHEPKFTVFIMYDMPEDGSM